MVTKEYKGDEKETTQALQCKTKEWLFIFIQSNKYRQKTINATRENVLKEGVEGK